VNRPFLDAKAGQLVFDGRRCPHIKPIGFPRAWVIRFADVEAGSPACV